VLHCTVPDTRVPEKNAFISRVRALTDDGGDLASKLCRCVAFHACLPGVLKQLRWATPTTRRPRLRLIARQQRSLLTSTSAVASFKRT
jgi:hypothetical protein